VTNTRTNFSGVERIRVTTAEMRAENGYIHAIDGVIGM